MELKAGVSKELLSSRPFKGAFYMSILEARNHSASCISPSNLSTLPAMEEKGVCLDVQKLETSLLG